MTRTCLASAVTIAILTTVAFPLMLDRMGSSTSVPARMNAHAQMRHEVNAPLIVQSSQRADAGVLLPAVAGWTHGQLNLVAWAQTRFSRAGLTFPTVEFVFHGTAEPCHGHVGIYWHDADELHLCALNKKAILHELAHAWAHESLSDEQRTAFVGHRNLAAWNDHNLDWDSRGAEHAAEIITWALMDTNILVRWDEIRAGSTVTRHRLLTIPDSDADQLTAGYRLLTGRIPIDRINEGRRQQDTTEMPSPEANRRP